MQSEVQDSEKPLSTIEAAAMIGITAGTLEVWRSTKRFHIPYFKMGSRVVYHACDVKEFVQTRRVGESKQFTPRKKAKGKAS